MAEYVDLALIVFITAAWAWSTLALKREHRRERRELYDMLFGRPPVDPDHQRTPNQNWLKQRIEAVDRQRTQAVTQLHDEE